MTRDDYRLRMGTTWVLAVVILIAILAIVESIWWLQ